MPIGQPQVTIVSQQQQQPMQPMQPVVMAQPPAYQRKDCYYAYYFIYYFLITLWERCQFE